jgi:hypothetical protein
MADAFVLDTDMEAVREGFRVWLTALTAGATQRSKDTWWLPAERLLLRLNSDMSAAGSVPNASLAYDGTGRRWTVEINPPSRPGNANSASGLARDKDGRRWLLRQAWLQRNTMGDVLIQDPEFRQATGLMPVDVDVAAGPRDRGWYRVALLDASPEDIRSETAQFVARCAIARSQHSGDPDTEALKELFGAPETGGAYTVPKRSVPEALVRRLQGDVWQALSMRLGATGKPLDKPKHAAGYEVDGVIDFPSGPLLIEIKTSLFADDVYAGVGQLMLYRQLLPSLLNHRLVLLLPSQPKSVLADAVARLGILIETYERVGENGEQIIFSSSFQKLCGF